MKCILNFFTYLVLNICVLVVFIVFGIPLLIVNAVRTAKCKKSVNKLKDWYY